jgi:hypothetical protein
MTRMFTNIDNDNDDIDDNIKYKSDKKMPKLSEPHIYCLNVNEMFSMKTVQVLMIVNSILIILKLKDDIAFLII